MERLPLEHRFGRAKTHETPENFKSRTQYAREGDGLVSAIRSSELIARVRTPPQAATAAPSSLPDRIAGPSHDHQVR
jgi:hypothetical protein